MWPPTELEGSFFFLRKEFDPIITIYLLDPVFCIQTRPAIAVGGRSGSRGPGGWGSWRLTGAVEVAVAAAERGVDEAADGGLLHPPDAQPHRGHPVAAAQRHRRRGALGRHAPLDSAAAAALLLGFSAALRLALLSLPPCCLRCNLD